MHAAILTGPRRIAIETVPDPVPGPGEVLVRVAFCGLCGTDLHDWRGGSGSRIPAYPLNPGHESAGTIAAIGPDVSRVAPGDRVTVHPYFYCGVCHYCRVGLINACERRSFVRDALAEFLVVDQDMVYRIPDSMTFETAALAEPLGAALQAIDLASIESGSAVLVIGAGPIGLSVAALAHRSGAAKVIVSEPSAERRRIALALGATDVINPVEEDMTERVLQLTGGFGADAVFECVTRAATTEAGIRSLRFGGQIVLVGNASPDDRLALDLDEVHRRQLTIRGTFSRASVFPRVLNWLNDIDFSPLITHTMDLDDVADAIALAESAEAGKILIRLGNPVAT